MTRDVFAQIIQTRYLPLVYLPLGHHITAPTSLKLCGASFLSVSFLSQRVVRKKPARVEFYSYKPQGEKIRMPSTRNRSRLTDQPSNKFTASDLEKKALAPHVKRCKLKTKKPPNRKSINEQFDDVQDEGMF